jgi:hypothetical protein
MTERDSSAAGPVFLSYASQNAATAMQLCSALEAAGQPCWVAPRDVRGGEPYAAEIVRAITSCSMLLVLVSCQAVESAHVLSEVERAFSKKKPILAVRIDDVILPPALEYFLSTHHWLDAGGAQLSSLAPRVIETARRIVASAGAAAPGKLLRRRSQVLAAAVLAAAFLTAVVAWWWRSASPHAGGAGAVMLAANVPAVAPKSVGVLPFVDLSERRDQQYFSDGLTVELFDRL